MRTIVTGEGKTFSLFLNKIFLKTFGKKELKRYRGIQKGSMYK